MISHAHKHKNHVTARSCWTDGYDAAYCVECNEWLTSKCGDPMCMYCAERPERPLPASENPRAVESERRNKVVMAAIKAGTYDPEKEY